jgi:cobalt/nickel transport system permease protein
MSEIYLIDYYSNIITSPFHRLTPLTKIIFLAFLLLSIILSKSILFLLLIFGLVISLILISNLPLFKILKWILYPIFFAVLFSISQIQYGLLPLLTFLRAVCAALCLFLIFCTTPYPVIFSFFGKISPSLMNLFFFTYRYLFLIIDEIQKKLKILKIRGGYANYAKIFKNIAYVIGHFLVHSLEKSDGFYHICQIRGYRGRLSFKTDYKLSLNDFIFAGLAFLIFIFAVFVN